jgi:two-component system response regulator MprA
MDSSRILIVEDEPEMAQLLTQALTEYGFECRSAANGAQGLSMITDADLLLVDIMMPVMNGLTMVETLRQDGDQTPVIFLTAKDETRDVVNGLEAGGDDYLVKPFKLDELIARVRAALRRAKKTSPVLFSEGFRLDCIARTAFRDEFQLFLSSTEFILLELFLRHAGEILSKRLILREVWSDEGYRDENIVELYVNYLRKKTEAFGAPRIINTVRGRGYVFGNVEMES